MIRHPLSHPFRLGRSLAFLLLCVLLLAGCPPTTGTRLPSGQQTKAQVVEPQVTGSSLAAVRSLEKAQNLFNEAVKSDQPTVDTPSAALQKYSQVVELVNKNMGALDASGKVSAYALLAFSQWRLGNYAKAMEAGNAGRHIFETEKLTGNRRDYGMCLTVGGLSVASQTYKEYENLRAPVTKELAQNLTGRLEQAMRAIDAGNAYLDRREDIAVYTNLWQLALVDAAVRIWTSGPPPEVARPEICRWLDRANPVFARFPDTAYPWQTLIETYRKKFEQKKKADCQGR
jgi:hypothetical protein